MATGFDARDESDVLQQLIEAYRTGEITIEEFYVAYEALLDKVYERVDQPRPPELPETLGDIPGAFTGWDEEYTEELRNPQQPSNLGDPQAVHEEKLGTEELLAQVAEIFAEQPPGEPPPYTIPHPPPPEPPGAPPGEAANYFPIPPEQVPPGTPGMPGIPPSPGGEMPGGPENYFPEREDAGEWTPDMLTDLIQERAQGRMEQIPRDFNYTADYGSVSDAQNELLKFMEDTQGYSQEFAQRAEAIPAQISEAAAKMGLNPGEGEALAKYSGYLHEPYVQGKAKTLGVSHEEYEGIRTIVANRMYTIQAETERLAGEFEEAGVAMIDEERLRILAEETELLLRNQDLQDLWDETEDDRRAEEAARDEQENRHTAIQIEQDRMATDWEGLMQ